MCEAPATDTGNLVNSAYTEKLGQADYETGFTAEYAAHLEFGAPNAHIAPRPYLRPAVEALRQAFIADIKRIVEEGGWLIRPSTSRRRFTPR